MRRLEPSSVRPQGEVPGGTSSTVAFWARSPPRLARDKGSPPKRWSTRSAVNLSTSPSIPLVVQQLGLRPARLRQPSAKYQHRRGRSRRPPLHHLRRWLQPVPHAPEPFSNARPAEDLPTAGRSSSSYGLIPPVRRIQSHRAHLTPLARHRERSKAHGRTAQRSRISGRRAEATPHAG